MYFLRTQPLCDQSLAEVELTIHGLHGGRRIHDTVEAPTFTIKRSFLCFCFENVESEGKSQIVLYIYTNIMGVKENVIELHRCHFIRNIELIKYLV